MSPRRRSPSRIGRSRTKSKNKSLPQSYLSEANLQYYYGHGKDICKDKQLDIRKVPKNSTQITPTKCGYVHITRRQNDLEEPLNIDVNLAKNIISKQISPNLGSFQLRKEFLKPERQYAFLDEKGKPSQNLREISVHRPRDQFVNNMFTPGKVRTGEEYLIHKAGMQTIETLKLHYSYQGASLQRMITPLETIRDAIHWIYQYAKYPSYEQVDAAIDAQFVENPVQQNRTFPEDIFDEMYTEFVRAAAYVTNQLKISLNKMLKQYPGVHFQNLCRSVNPDCADVAEARRIESPNVLTI